MEKLERDRFWTNRKVGAVVCVAAMSGSIVLSNLDNIETWRHYASGGSMTISPPGCEIEFSDPTPEEEEIEQLVAGEKSAATEATEGMNVGDMLEFAANIPAALAQHAQYMWLKRGDDFVMPGTESVFMVHADEQVQFNEENFNLVYKGPLNLRDEYEHSEVRQMMDCYEEFLFENKGAKGDYTHILVAPGGQCIRFMRFQSADQVEECDAHGATPPAFKFEFLGFTLIDYRIIMLSTEKEGEDASQDISDRLAHEVKHHYQSSIGQIFRLDPDEQFVQSVDGVTDEHLHPDGVPRTIIYPSQQSVSVDDQG